MSLEDGEMHAMAGVGVGLTAAAGVFLLLASGWSGCRIAGGDDADARPPLEMQAIEASIAYKRKPAKQPQKRTRRPDPVKPVEGAAHEDKPRDDKKPPDKKKQDDKKPAKDDFKIPDRTDDLDLPVNDKPPTDVGEFNDNTRGFAEVTSGHPFFRELAADFHDSFKFPSILSAEDTAAGCLHILANGTIKSTKVDPRSSNPELNDAIERALAAIENKRNTPPYKPVPTDLLAQATTRWICFRAKL